MTVVILSMVAMLVVVIVAVFASKGDKGSSAEDPDLSPAEKRSAAATTAAMAGIGQKQKRDH